MVIINCIVCGVPVEAKKGNKKFCEKHRVEARRASVREGQRRYAKNHPGDSAKRSREANARNRKPVEPIKLPEIDEDNVPVFGVRGVSAWRIQNGSPSSIVRDANAILSGRARLVGTAGRIKAEDMVRGSGAYRCFNKTGSARKQKAE